jgi:hypothetical protein
MQKKAYDLVKSIKAFNIYILHSRVIAYVPSTSVKDILFHPDMNERRSKWIAKILEFDLEINPTKLVKGQGLASMLVESNCKVLGVNFINTCSENQQTKFFDIRPQVNSPLEECTWYKDIIFFFKNMQPPNGMDKKKVRSLNLKSIRYCLID